MSVLYFRVTLNLRCDCGCGPIHFAACSLGGCVYLGMFDNVCVFSGCQVVHVMSEISFIVVCRHGHNEIRNRRLKCLLCIICGCGPNDQP